MPRKHKYRSVGKNLLKNPVDGMYHGKKMVDGQIFTAEFNTTDLQTAKRKRNEWLIELQQNTPSRALLDKTLEEVFEAYIASRPGKERKHLRKLWTKMKACRTKLELNTLYRKITPEFCTQWIAGIEDDEGRIIKGGLVVTRGKRVGQLIGAKHYNASVKLSTDVGAWARKRGYRLDDPFELADLGTREPEKIKRVTPSMEQVDAILEMLEHMDICDRNKDQIIDAVRMMALCGLGLAEIMYLTWDMFDKMNAAIHVTRIKTRHKFWVPVYPWCNELINELRRKAESPGGRGTAPGTPLFSIRQQCVAPVLARACVKLGITHFTPRSFRRYFIYRCYWAGIPEEEVAKLQGHRDGGKLVRKVYLEARCADEEARRKAQLAEQRALLAKATPFFTGQPNKPIPDLELPEANGSTPKSEPDAVATRLREAIAAEEANRKQPGHWLKPYQFKANGGAVMTQGQLISLVEQRETRRAKRQARKQKREARISMVRDHGKAGLQNLEKEALNRISEAVRYIRAASNFRQYVVDGEADEVNRKIQGAREARKAAEKELYEIRQAIKLAAADMSAQ